MNRSTIAPPALTSAGREATTTPVRYLRGLGETRSRELEKIGIKTIADLLFYLPRRYLDRSTILQCRDLREGVAATVVGKVMSGQILYGGRRPRFELTLADGTGFMKCVWFNRANLWPKIFSRGENVAFHGKVTFFDGYAMIHPDFDKLGEEGEARFLHTGKIIPLYRSSEALGRVGLDSRGFRRLLRVAVDDFAHTLVDPLPAELRSRHRLLPLAEAVVQIHFPESEQALAAGRHRLKFDELFFLELYLACRKAALTTAQPGISFTAVGERTRQLVEKLPFQLTEAQRRVLREIRADMKAPRPMHRLLQGDVGSGKTVVALLAMLMAVENGYQAALMAPTEILAEQHYLTSHHLLEQLGVNVVLLVGGRKKSERERILEMIAGGEAAIVIGTHALIQGGVQFHRLGLVVVDEQHRFGVLQRAALREKGEQPDVLVMTATPIPRSLAMTLYGDLEVSIIDQLPAGRRPVRTAWRSSRKRQQIYEFVRREVLNDSQAYVVFPLVEETEKSDLAAARESYEALRQGIFRDLHPALLHGRMKAAEKEAVMAAFKTGVHKVLVATTVIEVGVDVPNATVMVIEHAERFGLSQLHQLRGRVGRGPRQSYCILIADEPVNEETRKRLQTLVDTTDGFRIAEADLEMRGPGEFFGTRQHGLPGLKIANPITDGRLLVAAREEAFALAKQDPQLQRPEHGALRAHLLRHYREQLAALHIG
ncbi:MAG: ATP-dependent DNA helicase RecG [candidate division KSB1 bacterium]|nr:ATP-dependent DNA helicase RecG [candidate division KSB1 bacterium]MDZ7275249.1 ATP-dependent DNA helicase RecG [candidate division KSB1 bacterium]MDZ7287417.1 ATP-dependent DNA helicase RecG [candidate division KSB1 bacterium]MDZ7299531.1 ATP-dependent DNA helicase RecG [candidate division KSB1 bacterium]MDZ7309116.1 ATP-dependent DNA helicase RecG [candidate division KSB1 bacterium]